MVLCRVNLRADSPDGANQAVNTSVASETLTKHFQIINKRDTLVIIVFIHEEKLLLEHAVTTIGEKETKAY